MSLHHINIVVTDLGRCERFFGYFGYRQVRSRQISGAWLDAVTGLEAARADFLALEHPDSPVTIELLHYIHPVSFQPQGIAAANGIGYRHIALAVDDIGAMRRQLQSEGVEFISGVRTNSYGASMCYARGPDGILVELLQQP